MGATILEKFWHKTLKQPFYLRRTIDHGSGQPVILLHGIGRTGHVWNHLVEQLSDQPYRVVAFDLLGFGASPRPSWLDYSADDHAKAVIASIQRIGASQKVIIVGHSMGCLVAVRIARLRPDLVKHLILFEMPLNDGLPDKKRYRLRLDLYYKIFEKLKTVDFTYNSKKARLLERLAKRVIGFEITPESWRPFVKSLENTIVNQTTTEDIAGLDLSMDVVYGTRDILVMPGKPELFVGRESNINTYTVRAGHIISTKASKVLAERVRAADHHKNVLG